MIFIPLEKDSQEEIKNFLLQHEPFCVSLIQKINENLSSVYYLRNMQKKISAVIAVSKGGSFSHCLPDIELLKNTKTETSFVKIVQNHKLFCINGEQNGTNLLLYWLKKNKLGAPSFINNYHLMKILSTKSATIKKTTDGTVFRKCTKNDVQLLLPLELAYQKEEVLPSGQNPSPAVHVLTLSQQISRNAIFAAIKDGKFISKASINGTSWNYAQIGGVYTLQEYRRQGFSYATIQNLLSFLADIGKKPVLFVNTKNHKAINLYKKLGFSKISPYRIAYF